MIEVNNLIKKFGDFRALDGVNMHVASGNIYGLVGPNGAGKSTLIRHLTGVYRQDAGEIFIDGAPVYENKQVKAQMAYIPDEPFYFLQADTLEMMRYFRGMYESFDEKMFYRLQEFFPGIDMKRNIRRLTVRESPSEIAAAAGSRTAPSRPPATVANPTPFEAHPRGKVFEFRSPRIEVSKQAQTFALYRVDATKARMRSATAQIRTTLPPERRSIRDSSRHEPEHPSPTTATFMHARWRFFAFNS